MFGLLKRSSPGGGPAPLLSNPHPSTLRWTAWLHIIFFGVSAVAAVAPSLLDKNTGCFSQSDTTIYPAVCSVISLIIVAYFLAASLKKVASAEEWMKALSIILLLIVAELGISAWGAWLLVRYLIAVSTPECSRSSGNLVFGATCTVVSISACCMIANLLAVFILFRSVSVQLDALRTLY